MQKYNKKSLFLILGAVLLVWLGMKYLLSIALPFLLGTLLAVAAEPLVSLLSRRLPRAGASILGVTATMLLLACLLALLGAMFIREVGLLAKELPDLGEAAQSGIDSLASFLLRLAEKAPRGVQPLLFQTVTGLFDSSSALVTQLVQRLPSLATAVLGWIPGSALATGTGILSAYMLSVRLPSLRRWLHAPHPELSISRYLPVLRQMRSALGGWLKAQLKLTGICFCIVSAGLLLLRIPHGIIWAALIALVDAVPILGTGTVLLPWSLICLIQGRTAHAVGLVAIYITAMLSRSILEPRLVGKQLGIDPLITLAALYAGFRLWGIGGILVAPLVCVAGAELLRRSG